MFKPNLENEPPYTVHDLTMSEGSQHSGERLINMETDTFASKKKRKPSSPQVLRKKKHDGSEDDDFESDQERAQETASGREASSSSKRQDDPRISNPSSPMTSVATATSSTQNSIVSAMSKPAVASTPVTAIPKTLTATDLPNPFHDVKPIPLPAGVAGAVGQYLVESNRPVNITTIVQKFKETYTRAQIEKALAQLVEKRVAETLDDGTKIYWINQALVDEALSSSSQMDASTVNAWCDQLNLVIGNLEKAKANAQEQVRALIMAPTDEELDKYIHDESALVSSINDRLLECEKLVAEAQKRGLNAAALHASNVTDLRSQLLFYRGQWRDRKKQLTDFIEKVCDAKNLKGSGKRDLLEKIGIETDEMTKVTLLKGATV